MAEANARGDQLRTALEATQADLTVSQAELTQVQAELHQAQFQLGQQKILCQVKEREIQRFRSAALSATDAGQPVSQAAAASSAVPDYPNHQLSSLAPTESLPSWVHLDAPVSTSPVIEEVHVQSPQKPEASSSDPRIDQLVDAVQLITNRLENFNGSLSPATRVEDDLTDETMTERKIIDSRALLHLRLKPKPSDAAGFRTWKNHFVVQFGKLDISSSS